jgi:hypothetical protein
MRLLTSSRCLAGSAALVGIVGASPSAEPRQATSGREFPPLSLINELFTMTQRCTVLPKMYTNLNLGEIKPTGWLKNQLTIQAEGLAGNLNLFYPLYDLIFT